MMLASRLVREQRLIRPRPIFPSAADQQRTAASTTIPVVRLTAGTPAHTDGVWAQLIASTTVASSWIDIWSAIATFGSAANGTMLLDLSVGDGAQNPVSTLIEDYQIGYNIESFTFGNAVTAYSLPLHIPQGVEVIGRIRSGIASDICDLALQLYGSSAEPVFRNCTTYGSVPGSSRGTILTVPGANHTKGAWTELSAAITNPIYAVGYGVGGTGSTAFSGVNVFVDVGAGSAGNERVIVSDLYVTYSTSESIAYDHPFSLQGRNLAQPLGQGERLVARYQTSNIASGQGVDLIIYGYS